ncbi:MAG: transcriptional repressor [Saprospiraceae bacterium]|nr:transcriptional repressor [Saprospiraceae bacterium]|tara:strand:- start:2149 stop:2565 length:417 start_codon:yes stop_codon:yes gene_type:complete
MTRYSEIKKILKSHKLRVTDGRVDTLEFFLRQAKTLSLKDLEKEFKNSDRVTLYRTLSSFTEHGVLHKIPDDSGHATYGLCHDTCSSEDHSHDHMHFKCNECGTIECLEQNIPVVKIPGYHVKEANLILKGICKTCAA